jgi:hypothetical protein
VLQLSLRAECEAIHLETVAWIASLRSQRRGRQPLPYNGFDSAESQTRLQPVKYPDYVFTRGFARLQ